MQQYNWERLNIHYHFTPNINNSVGFVFSDYDEDEAELYATQWNHLIYRKNKKKSLKQTSIQNFNWTTKAKTIQANTFYTLMLI